jgi:hypothetical protein
MFASGVILSGATTSSSLFFRLSPVSFYLAQCGILQSNQYSCQADEFVEDKPQRLWNQ